MTNDLPERGNRRVTGHPDRRSAHTYIDADGTLIFGDHNGTRWQVYDRRSGERRGNAWTTMQFYRAFVNESGEEWRYQLAAAELIDETASTLQRQLERAVRVEPTPTD